MEFRNDRQAAPGRQVAGAEVALVANGRGPITGAALPTPIAAELRLFAGNQCNRTAIDPTRLGVREGYRRELGDFLLQNVGNACVDLLSIRRP